MRKYTFKMISIGIIVLSASFLLHDSALGQSVSSTGSSERTQQIISNCKHFVYTVSAYSTIKAAPDKNISDESELRRNVGTAISIDLDGYLITTNNVVENAEKITVKNCAGKVVEARLLGCDITGRIAVLKIDKEYVSAVPVSLSLNNISTGMTAFAFGVVSGMSIDIHDGVIGEIWRKDGTFELKTDKFSGTSGTPVIDENECVMGLLAYQVEDHKSGTGSSENSYIIMSLDYATVLARRVIDENKPKCGWLGVSLDLTLSGNGGILVEDVQENSPASLSNIMANDLIYEFNGESVSDINQFSRAFAKTKTGDTVNIKLIRGDSRVSVEVTLVDR